MNPIPPRNLLESFQAAQQQPNFPQPQNQEQNRNQGNLLQNFQRANNQLPAQRRNVDELVVNYAPRIIEFANINEDRVRDQQFKGLIEEMKRECSSSQLEYKAFLQAAEAAIASLNSLTPHILSRISAKIEEEKLSAAAIGLTHTYLSSVNGKTLKQSEMNLVEAREIFKKVYITESEAKFEELFSLGRNDLNSLPRKIISYELKTFDEMLWLIKHLAQGNTSWESSSRSIHHYASTPIFTKTAKGDKFFLARNLYVLGCYCPSPDSINLNKIPEVYQELYSNQTYKDTKANLRTSLACFCGEQNFSSNIALATSAAHWFSESIRNHSIFVQLLYETLTNPHKYSESIIGTGLAWNREGMGIWAPQNIVSNSPLSPLANNIKNINKPYNYDCHEIINFITSHHGYLSKPSTIPDSGFN